MSTSIQKAIDAAFKVFSRSNGNNISRDSLAEIKNHINNVTKRELNIDPNVLEKKIASADEAPVTYIRVLEDKLMTVAIFVLRQGKRLPLHDHPRMHGVLKVIHGRVTINTYTQLDSRQHPVPTSLTDNLAAKYGKPIPVYPTRFEGRLELSEEDECCDLSPDEKNIHEICSEFGNAAFLDVLSPPYNQKSVNGYTQCGYYKQIDTSVSDSSVRYLVKINPPQDYWCDEVNYTGPELPVPVSEQEPGL